MSVAQVLLENELILPDLVMRMGRLYGFQADAQGRMRFWELLFALLVVFLGIPIRLDT